MRLYTLMHKDQPCAVVALDSITGNMMSYKTLASKYTPFLGGCDQQKFKKWWEMRAVPASRDMMQQTLRDAGVLTAAEYLAKNLAVSVTDSYWLCPEGSKLTYDDVNIRRIASHGQGIVPYHNATSYNPNASLGGQMTKYWDLTGEIPVLVKESYKYFGQQGLNEVLASRIHAMQGTNVPFVRYTASRMEDGGIECRCDAFTNERTEFVPAYEVIESRHIKNSQNLYSAYIEIAAEHGADKVMMQEFMDYQTLTDFLISNTDEHLLNFGLLRDTNSMRVTGPAPIFDSGNSMFYADERLRPYTRAELLQRKITGFYKTEDKMLVNVKDPHVLKLDMLPSTDLIKEFYTKAGIPDNKAEIIAHGYEDKISFIDEMQHGIRVSLYREKQKEKNEVYLKVHGTAPDSKHLPQQFIMVAGIPGSGKRTCVSSMLQKMQDEGYTQVSAIDLYPAERADQSSLWFVDKNSILRSLKKDAKSHLNEVVYINPNDIRNERTRKGLPVNDNLVFAAVYARIKQASLNGETVIYSASNLDKKQRESALQAYGTAEGHRKLIVLYANPEKMQQNVPENVMEEMAVRLHVSAPDKGEGWDEIETVGEDPLMEERDYENRDDDLER